MRNNRKGFTIVELVIVIAVIAILAGVLIPTFGGMIKKANESKALQEAKNTYTADLALLDGQVENYGLDKYKEDVYTEATGLTAFVEGTTYYTEENGTYTVAQAFESRKTYYTHSYGDSICTGTFSGETYEITVGDYTCTYANGAWKIAD